jgi:hypothetical protein
MPALELLRTPEHTVTCAFAALKSKDYRALAELCDLLSLRSFKAEVIESFPCWGDEAGDSWARSTPVIELTDEQYEEWGKYLDPLRQLNAGFPDLSTVEELVAMEPVDVFASWLTAKSYDRYLAEDSSAEPWERSDSEWRGDSPRDQRGQWPDYQIIGCVYDPPDIAHVLYRNRLSAAEASKGYDSWLSNTAPEHREFMTAMHHRGEPILITCRRQTDGSWRLVAKRHFMLFGSLEIIELHSDE